MHDVIPKIKTMTRVAAAAAFAAATGMVTYPALAAIPGPLLEYSSIYGVGGTITIIRLPVVKGDGTVVYKDVQIQLTANARGVLSLSGTLVQMKSPILLVANIVAGLYGLASNSAYQMTVSGPGLIADGGVGKWSIVANAGYPCGAPATFYTGPIDGNPLYSTRLKPAHITSTEYSYGIVDAGAACIGNGWSSGSIIGVAQLGNQIEIASFTNPSTGQDQSTPYNRELYNLVN